jgi:hypothetical protein
MPHKYYFWLRDDFDSFFSAIFKVIFKKNYKCYAFNVSVKQYIKKWLSTSPRNGYPPPQGMAIHLPTEWLSTSPRNVYPPLQGMAIHLPKEWLSTSTRNRNFHYFFSFFFFAWVNIFRPVKSFACLITNKANGAGLRTICMGHITQHPTQL